MIQRKQTLFLFLSGFLNVALLFLASKTVAFNGALTNVALVPLRANGLASTAGHTAAIYLNFGLLVLTFVTVFIYNKRQLQVKLCYLSAFIWIVLAAMIALCPFVVKAETISGETPAYLSLLLTAGGIVSNWMASKFIKKDIELLRSADRIR